MPMLPGPAPDHPLPKDPSPDHFSLGSPAPIGPSDPHGAIASLAQIVASRKPVTIWGLPLLPVTMCEALDEVDRLIQGRQAGYFITANLHYAMLTDRNKPLSEVNAQAAFLLADGMPMVWYSRLLRKRLPERVAGSDLIYKLCERAAQRHYKIFFLGGGLGVAEEAASKLCRIYPGMQVAGVEAPPFKPLTAEENRAMVQRVRDSQADILLVAFGQPKGELWLHENYRELGVPACVQLGASFDFVTGRVRRAPRWCQRTGMEWAWRLCREPRRLGPRYAADAIFLCKAVLRDLAGWCLGKAT